MSDYVVVADITFGQPGSVPRNNNFCNSLSTPEFAPETVRMNRAVLAVLKGSAPIRGGRIGVHVDTRLQVPSGREKMIT